MVPLDWSRFNAIIVTRHSCKPLYEKNIQILSKIPYEKQIIENPPAGDYVWHCITQYEGKYDYVINIDDDAFLSDLSGLFDVLVTMEIGGYDYAGMPDGMTWTPRDIFNPASMNPFFNVFHVQRILEKLKAFPRGLNTQFTYGLIESLIPALKEKGFCPEALAAGVTWETLAAYHFPTDYEPFYPIFFALLNAGCRPLLLYGCSWNGERCDVADRVGMIAPSDWWTTVLYTADKKPFLYHTWLARDYFQSTNSFTPLDNRERIDNAFRSALKELER
jgi:hypothetical protein